VYAGEMTAELSGAPHQQWVYFWRYPASGHWCWLRVTLDSLGFPVIWETLTDGDDAVALYAARSLEEQAAKQFGAPDGDGAFALARGAKTAGNAVLVRILNDGPVPMGPMVYVDARRAVTTVICRCMPSQVESISATANYALAPAETQPALPVAPSAASAYLPEALLRSCPVGRALADAGFLERQLRLPAGF
ncbi:MAG TPA: hypothetical protein P5572_15990, partial [Phycisphaerae bacterium]|nr:hypothetical protein [Phycisphaerae bacterium]